MSRRITGLFAGAAIALTAALGTVAIAQPAPPAGAEAPRHQFSPEEHAQKLSQLLQLRPNQQAAALAFVTALAPHRDGMERMKDWKAERPATTPERLDRMEQMMGERAAKMHERIEATRRFYAQLDPTQQQAFDALPPMMGHRGGRHGGPDGGHGMHHRGGPDGRGPGNGGPPPPAN